ncbi:MAG: hypothetical protein C4582_01705 [Desulfobacteraceae bacterium]|nr:MAG: hypothetical protein C4582_01705 [Desulfobacteraceae bacterium]
MKRGRSRQRSGKSGGTSPRQPEVVEGIISRLDDTDISIVQDSINDADLACQLIEAMPVYHSRIVTLIQALKQKFPDKKVAKAAKRVAFKLKQAGISHEDIELNGGKDPPVLKARGKEEVQAMMGPVLNLSGARAVLLIRNSSLKGTYVGMGMASPEEGISDFLFRPVSRKMLRGLEEDIDSAVGPLVEVEAPFLSRVLEDAFKAGGKGASDPNGYKMVRPWLLEEAPPFEDPLYMELPEQVEQDDLITDSQAQELFAAHPLNAWVPDHESIASFYEQRKTILESPLVLSDFRKKEREREIRDNIATEIFTDSKRKMISRLLAEMAYFFNKKGEDRLKELAVLAAGTIRKKLGSGQSDAIIDLLVSRGIAAYEEIYPSSGDKTEKGREEGNLIIQP